MTRDAKVLSKKLEKERAQRIVTAKKSLLDTYGEVLRTLKNREDALLDEADHKKKLAEDEVERQAITLAIFIGLTTERALEERKR